MHIDAYVPRPGEPVPRLGHREAPGSWSNNFYLCYTSIMIDEPMLIYSVN
jgi:hypothetical protein